ncbi:MAG: lytic transglycosylase domain-containing protein [Campylobacteraceae bacterium]|jgi:soluble lytic murein transglycosylase|nr:lytic transglycosylase domain-containing protein [Campylobacteraceae bacterium]
MPTLFKFLLLSLFFYASTLFGAALSYQELKTKPKSIAKDYYIYRLLAETANVTIEQAKTLYEQVSRMNGNLETLFEKKLGQNENKQKTFACQKSAQKDLNFLNQECVKLLVHPPFVASLDSKSKTKLIKKLKNDNNSFAAGWAEAMSSKDIFTALKKKGAKEFLAVFNSMPQSYRKSHFDKKLNFDFIKLLEKEDGYEKFIKTIVIGEQNFSTLPKSLIYNSQNSSLSYNSYFFLGINAVKFKKTELAEKFFNEAEKKAYYKYDKDKAMFWQYLMNKNNETLRRLSESHDVNIYSLYAKEAFDLPVLSATFVTPSQNEPKENFDMQDPFAWREFLDTIKNISPDEAESLSEKFNSEQTLPIHAFLLERAMQYRRNYFIVPFGEYLADFDDERKIVILSLARQESRFVTSTISTSYALGMMQFMPFLARNIAKEQKIKNFDIDDMFKPEVSYKFANIHLDYLTKYLYHPLFIAYAYNGGIGFTKRMLQSNLFFKKGDYEPFLSMETIGYEESREYGKKVLANYIMYSKYFGKDISIKALLSALIKPKETDKFR